MARMRRVEVAHTGQLPAEVLTWAHGLLVDVFDDLDDADWEHCLGGLHALAFDGDELVAHAALVQRRLLLDGRAWRTGYVEGVAVRSDVRRQGHGSAVMTALEDVARRAYELAALGASDAGAAFYAARGWQLWQGPTSALTPDGVVRTPEDDDDVFVLPLTSQPLDLSGAIVCDWREGDVW
jgi:aminoglycoside 2'-N-acetyltransferase I